MFHISCLKLLFLLSSGRLDCVSPENTDVFLLTFLRSIFTNTHCLINHTKLSWSIALEQSAMMDVFFPSDWETQQSEFYWNRKKKSTHGDWSSRAKLKTLLCETKVLRRYLSSNIIKSQIFVNFFFFFFFLGTILGTKKWNKLFLQFCPAQI